jgi:hypothetical protein
MSNQKWLLLEYFTRKESNSYFSPSPTPMANLDCDKPQNVFCYTTATKSTFHVKVISVKLVSSLCKVNSFSNLTIIKNLTSTYSNFFHELLQKTADSIRAIIISVLVLFYWIKDGRMSKKSGGWLSLSRPWPSYVIIRPSNQIIWS